MASRRERAINLPAPLVVWIGLLVAIQAVRSFLDVETDVRLLLDTAFLPAPWTIALGQTTPEAVIAAVEARASDADAEMRLALAQFVVRQPLKPWSALTYSLLHGSWPHVGVNCLWLAAFGALVVRRIGAARSLVFWAATALGGALAHWLGDKLGADIMLGSSASISGFMVAAMTLVYAPPGAGRWDFLRNRNVLIFIGVWLFANLAFAIVAVPLGLSEADIAWRSHIGGGLVALALFPFLDPAAGARSDIRLEP